MKLGFVLLSAALATAGVARSAAIVVNNPSFESVVLPDGAVGPATAWTVGGGTALSHNPTATELPGGPTDGSQVLFLQAFGVITQTLSAVLTADTIYTLLVDIGSRADSNPIAGYQISLEAGATVLGTANSPLPANGSFLTASVHYTALSGDANLGQTLLIRLRNAASGAGTALMDNVRLDGSATAVPEPGYAPLLGMLVAAAMGMKAWRAHSLR